MINQRQRGGDDSVNLQGSVVVYQNGISYSDAREIAFDVFKANALELAGLAKSALDERFQWWSEMFLRKLQATSPDLLGALVDPDIQYSLFSAQRDFSRSGDTALGEALADLLVLRCQSDSQSLEKLVLNEAIATLPKLTQNQVKILTLIWMLTQVYEPEVETATDLAAMWSRELGPVIDGIQPSRQNLDHLSYAGCASFGMVYNTIYEITMRNYGACFGRGIHEDEVQAGLKDFWSDDRIFKPLPNNSSLKRVAQKGEMRDEFLTYEQKAEVERLRERFYPTMNEVQEKLSPGFSGFPELCTLWDDSSMCAAYLTTVGTAIAHSNWVRIHGPEDNLGLGRWLGD